MIKIDLSLRFSPHNNTTQLISFQATIPTMSEATFHTTKDDLRKPESRTSRAHDGKNPPGTSLSAMKVSRYPSLVESCKISQISTNTAAMNKQSIIDTNTNKPEQINQAQSNLPLPDQPPVASDWNSFDQRTVNVGSGRFQSSATGEKGPATAESSARIDGDEYHKNTEP